MSNPTLERARPPRTQPPQPPVSIDESKLFRHPRISFQIDSRPKLMHVPLTAGRPPPDRGSLEPRSSEEGVRMPRSQHSRLGDNSNISSHRTMSAESRQTLAARHAGSKTPYQRSTGNGSTAEDVEKNVVQPTRDKNTPSFLQRARGKHLKRIPTIKQSLVAVLTQSCTFSSAPHLALGHSG